MIAIVGVVLLLGGLGAVKGAQIAAIVSFGREQEERGPAPEAVDVWTATERAWESTIDAVGTLTSKKGVSIGAEVPGMVSRITFESGQLVQEGDVLVELDASVERAQLESARARERLAKSEAGRTRTLVKSGFASREELDQAEAALRTARADVAALAAQIERKIVRAPFAGRLGIRQIDLGQYLEAGTPITALETTDTLYADFTVPQQRLPDVAVGMPVRVEAGEGLTLEGAIATVEPSVDESTRALQLRALLPNAPEVAPLLRTGMFVDVQVLLPERRTFVTVPATAIVHAPHGDSVFVVEEKPPGATGIRQTAQGQPVHVARQQFVRTGPRKGDFIAISEGLQAGQVVVSAGAFKLSNGSPIFVSDIGLLPEPSLNPHPQNR